MTETLSGNLRKVPLLDILQLLSTGGRTGRLDLQYKANNGEIYLREGKIVHAVTGAQMGEVAVYTLMGWLEGNFNFVSDVEAPEESVTKKTEEGTHERPFRLLDKDYTYKQELKYFFQCLEKKQNPMNDIEEHITLLKPLLAFKEAIEL